MKQLEIAQSAIELHELLDAVRGYFKWLDATKKFPSAGFAKSKNKAERRLRQIVEGRPHDQT